MQVYCFFDRLGRSCKELEYWSVETGSAMAWWWYLVCYDIPCNMQ
jgi:hypothetical protein